MTEMRYELAIERIENIKGENTCLLYTSDAADEL